MSSAPLASIYIPTRGRPDLVRRAVKSALAQTFDSFEIIVVIDGPDPLTEQALAQLGPDPRLKVEVLPERGGACRARNHAIFKASGEFITGLDDDDELLPHHVSVLHSSLVRSGCAFACTTAVLRRDEVDLVRHRFAGKVTLAQLTQQNVVGNQVFTRTAFLRELGGFDPEMPAWQDYDLWLRLSANFGPGVRIDARTYIQHLDHVHERISDPSRIDAAYRRFVTKHSELLDEQARCSLELLRFATSHEPFPPGTAWRFIRAGLVGRTLSAIFSDQFPKLRTPARRLQSVLSRKRF